MLFYLLKGVLGVILGSYLTQIVTCSQFAEKLSCTLQQNK